MSLAGFQATQGRLTLVGVIGAGVAGAMLGNTFWYLVARAYGRAQGAGARVETMALAAVRATREVRIKAGREELEEQFRRDREKLRLIS